MHRQRVNVTGQLLSENLVHPAMPGNPADGFEDETQEMAAATWSGTWWEHGGGGTAYVMRINAAVNP